MTNLNIKKLAYRLGGNNNNIGGVISSILGIIPEIGLEHVTVPTGACRNQAITEANLYIRNIVECRNTLNNLGNALNLINEKYKGSPDHVILYKLGNAILAYLQIFKSNYDKYANPGSIYYMLLKLVSIFLVKVTKGAGLPVLEYVVNDQPFEYLYLEEACRQNNNDTYSNMSITIPLPDILMLKEKEFWDMYPNGDVAKDIGEFVSKVNKPIKIFKESDENENIKNTKSIDKKQSPSKCISKYQTMLIKILDSIKDINTLRIEYALLKSIMDDPNIDISKDTDTNDLFILHKTIDAAIEHGDRDFITKHIMNLCRLAILNSDYGFRNDVKLTNILNNMIQ